MRFLDADVLAGENGSEIPPLEVRLQLRPGDRVGLYEAVRHASMGAGYSPVEAVVLGSPEPGWFVGETEDGREVSFHAGNVADVEMGSPSMGGVFDWFKKIVPPMPGAQPPAPQQASLPAPAPQEQPGLIAKLKTLLPSKGEAAEKASIFDIFKKKPGLPAQRGEQAVVPAEKKESFFSILSPKSKVVVPFSKVAADIAVPKGPNPLAPYIEKFKEVFKIIPKSPEPPPKPQKEGQMQLWAGLFEQEAENAEQKPFEEIFTMFRPEEVQPTKEVLPPNLPKNLHRDIKVLPMPRRTTLFPSAQDVARGLMGLYNPIGDLWEMLREAREKPAWKKHMDRYGFAKEKFESIGTCGGPPTVFEELSSLLHIPWEEFRKRAKIADRGDYEEWVDDDLIWEDIVFPATELMSEAFDLIKPPDLPGRFSFEREVHGDSFCMLVATYTEGQEREGAYEQWKIDNNLESPEEVVAGLKRDDINPEGAMRQLEGEIKQLEADIAKLDRNSGTFQEDFDELSATIQYRKEIIDQIMEELSNEPPDEPPAQEAEPVDLDAMIQQLEESIVEQEQSSLELFKMLENLNVKDPNTRAMADELKRSMDEGKKSLQSLSKQLSELLEVKEAGQKVVDAVTEEVEQEEKAKRAPRKKKKGKKGK